jgi:hypothetical protein
MTTTGLNAPQGCEMALKDQTEDGLMKNLQLTGLLAGAVAFGVVSPALSHHSHAMFDHAKDVNITGTVVDFAYVNPHGSLDIAVNENGKKVTYWIEMSNLTNMVQRKIKKTTFKPGDKVSVKMHPLKDGRPGGSYVTIVAADGTLYQ